MKNSLVILMLGGIALFLYSCDQSTPRQKSNSSDASNTERTKSVTSASTNGAEQESTTANRNTDDESGSALTTATFKVANMVKRNGMI